MSFEETAHRASGSGLRVGEHEHLTLGLRLQERVGAHRLGRIGDACESRSALAIEAALFASRRAPNADRRLACESWPRSASEDARLFGPLREDLSARAVTPPPIFASDRDADAVEACRANARAAKVSLQIAQADAREVAPLDPPGQLLLNCSGIRRARGRGDDTVQVKRMVG